MPDFLMSYDLRRTDPPPHAEFLKQATLQGWKVWILGSNDYWYHLPNTTLEGTFANRDNAKIAFDRAVDATAAVIKVPVTVEKFILVAYSQALFNSDIAQKKQ